MRLSDIPIPSTAASAGAEQVLARFSSSPALVNHCVRSYLFAASLAALEDIEIDHELLHVASLLHDLGLEPAFDSHTLPFEQAGGDLAWVFTAGAGWPIERRVRASAIIVAHMIDVEVDDDPEGYLLGAATSLDISGYDPPRWPADLIAEIVAAHPRHDLTRRFTACFEDQAARKPDSPAAGSVRRGIAGRMAANPLEML